MTEINQRKKEHIELSLLPNVYGQTNTGLERYQLEFNALMDHDFSSIDLSREILGSKLSIPVIIGSMTGGSHEVTGFTQSLARCAAHYGLGLGLGSCRALCEHPDLYETYGFCEDFSNIPLVLGNIGVAQLVKEPSFTQELFPILDTLGVHGLYCHLNVLQEFIQPEGDRQFEGASRAISNILQQYSKPIVIKEVGSGISAACAEKLKSLGVRHVETAGLGGTSWVLIEGERCKRKGNNLFAKLSEQLATLGLPTAESIRACRQTLGETATILGSGGIQTAPDIIKALLLGADAVSIARPFLIAWHENGEQGIVDYIESLVLGLKITLLSLGCSNFSELKASMLKPIYY